MTQYTEQVVLPRRCIFVGGHYGDWTFCAAAFAGLRGRQLTVLMDRDAGRRFAGVIGNDTLGQWNVLDVSRPMIEVMLDIKDALEKEHLLCLLGDRVGQGMRTVKTTFFGAEAEFPLAPYELAKLFKCPIYTFYSAKTGLRRLAPYMVSVSMLWDGQSAMEADELARVYIKDLENRVRERPAHWFNFYDFWQISERAA